MRHPWLLVGLLVLLAVCTVYIYHNGKEVQWEQNTSEVDDFRVEDITNETEQAYRIYDKCTTLLQHGQWTEKGWQPRDCTLHKYTRSEVASCILKRAASNPSHKLHMVFIGDSRILETFYEAESYFKGDVKRVKHHDDMTFQFPAVPNFTLEYIHRQFSDNDHVNQYKTWIKSKPGQGRPDIVIDSVAAHMIRFYCEDKPREEAFKIYKDELKNGMLPYMKQLDSLGTRIIWKLQDPVVEANLGALKSKQMMTNEQFSLYNQFAVETFSGSNIEIWNVSRMVASHYLNTLTDGLHYRHNTKCQEEQLQIFWNAYCDPVMNLDDTTCCNKTFTTKQNTKKTIFKESVPTKEIQRPQIYSVWKSYPLLGAVFVSIICLIYWCEKYILRDDSTEKFSTNTKLTT